MKRDLSYKADMKYYSDMIFGQKVSTFHFDDSLEYFTVEYLFKIKGLIVDTIIQRHYLILTKETILTMEAKYIAKTLQGEDSMPLNLLGEILDIFDSRTICTIDEVDRALDESKEVNMAIGHSHPRLNPKSI